jgi:predicted RNA-binding protein YlqC (UPF0109 family)
VIEYLPVGALQAQADPVGQVVGQWGSRSKAMRAMIQLVASFGDLREQA